MAGVLKSEQNRHFFHQTDRATSTLKAASAPASQGCGQGESPVQGETKAAVVRRLRFAMAELEAIGGIDDFAADPALLQQIRALTEGVRGCINSLLKSSEVSGSPPT